MSETNIGRTVEIPIYNRVLKIIVSNNTQEALESINLNHIECEGVEGIVVEGSDGTINLIIKPNASMNTICHEAFHITSGVLSDAGMKLSNKSEEGYAYLIGWVAEEINKVLKSY